MLNLKCVLVFCFFCSILSCQRGFSQKMIEGIGTPELTKGELKIEFKLTYCSNVKRVELVELSTNKRTILTPLKGELNNLSIGNHYVVFDYKTANLFVDDEFVLHVFIDSCASLVKEKKYVAPEVLTKTKYKPHSVLLKLGVAGVGVFAALSANSIKSDFDSKVKVLNDLSQSLPQVNEQLQTLNDLETWNNAYSEAQKAQKTGLLNAMVATSILSLGYEIFLLTTKTNKIDKGFSFQPSSTLNGLSLTYKF